MINRLRQLWHYSQSYREPYKTYRLLNYLRRLPSNVGGSVAIGGYKVSYVDAHALSSMWQLQFMRRYNDFYSQKAAPRILDCGANIGVSTLRFKTLYPKSRITAFEPDPNIFAILQRNVSENNLMDVEVINSAVWVANGQMAFSPSGFGDSQAGHLSITSKLVDSSNVLQVSTIDLADYLSEPVDFIKMDIEGAELQVLQHCRDSLVNVSQMIVEVHHCVDEAQVLIDILQILADAMFKIALYQYFGPPTYLPYNRLPNAAADQFPVIWAWRS